MSYANSCICEYPGCHIFEIAGIPVQKTLLGTFTRNGKEKIVVACRDFTAPDTVIQDFASLKNTIIDSEHNGYGTELSDILMAMDEQQAIDPDALKKRFWDMFIVDALIGNWDRHNGNWGVLYNSRTDDLTLAQKLSAVLLCAALPFGREEAEAAGKVLFFPETGIGKGLPYPAEGVTALPGESA